MFTKDVDKLIDEQEGLEKMLNDTRLQREEWKKEQKKLDDFIQWCHNQQKLLDNPNHVVTYKEKREAVERLGLKAFAWARNHNPQYKIEGLPSEIVFTSL